jgi:arginase family enzyme
VRELGIPAVVERVRGRVGDTRAYVSFDVDFVDPAFAPGTGTPEIGGFTSREAQEFVRGLVGLDIVGCDVVEVLPPYDPALRPGASYGAPRRERGARVLEPLRPQEEKRWITCCWTTW